MRVSHEVPNMQRDRPSEGARGERNRHMTTTARRYRLVGEGGHVYADCATYEAAAKAAIDKFGPSTVVGGYPGDLLDGGHRSLVWESEERANNDSGYAACASIIEVEV